MDARSSISQRKGKVDKRDMVAVPGMIAEQDSCNVWGHE